MKKVNLYSLSYSVDENETGVDGNQINDFTDPKNDSVKRTDKYQGFYDDFLGDDFDLKKFSADEEAKPTDLLSSSYLNQNGFFVSTDFVELLKAFKICCYKYRNVYIKNLGEKKDYHFLNLIMCPKIDFEKSSFIIENDITEEQFEAVKLTSLQDYRDKLNKLHSDKSFDFTLSPQKLVLHDLCDLFMYEISGEYLISEELKKALEKSKLTGYEIEPFDVDFFH